MSDGFARRMFIMLSAAMLLSCTKTSTLNGTYLGTVEGDSKSKVTLILNTTGDGLISGEWNSDSEIKAGRISGTVGFFQKYNLVLSVAEGECRGDFPIKIDVAGKVVSGSVVTQPPCKPSLDFSVSQ